MSDSDDDFLHALFAESPDAVIVLDEETRVLAVNPAFVRLFGYTEAEVPGTSWATLCDADCENAQLAFEGAASLARSAFDGVYRARDGRRIEGETRAAPAGAGPDGRKRFIAIIRDATPERTLRKRLETSESRLRAAFASAGEGAFTINLQTGIGTISGFLCEFLGFDAADATISHERWREAVHPDDREISLNVFRTLASDPDNPVEAFYRMARADGEYRWMRSRGRVTQTGPDGKPLRAAGVIADVTDSKRLEEKLAASERRLREAVQSARESVWELDARTQTLRFSHDLVEAYSLKGGEAPVGVDEVLSVLHPEDRPAVQDAFARMLKGETMSVQYRSRRTDGGWAWVHTRGSVVERDEAGLPLRAVGVVADITERKELELRLAESERMLREAQASANEGAWSMDLATGDTQNSGIICRLFKLEGDPAPASLDVWRNALHPDDRPYCDSMVELLRRGEPLDVEARISDGAGGWIWVHNRGKACEWREAGKPVRATGLMTDITRRKKLEIRLANNERMLREAFNSANDGAWRYRFSDGSLTLYGEIASAFGTLDDAGRIPVGAWCARVHPDDRERFNAAMAGLAETGRISVEYRFLDASGRWRWIHDRGGVTEHDPDGSPRYAAGVVSDVSDRRELEYRLAEALAAAELATWSYDLVGHVAVIRGDLAVRLGIPADAPSISGDDWMRRHIHPEDKKALIEATLAVSDGRDEMFETLYRARDPANENEWRWIRSTGRVTERGADGRPLAAAGVLRDETERRALEVKLAESERLYREAMESAGDEAWQLDATTGQIQFSAALKRKFGLGGGDGPVPLSAWVGLVHPEDHEICAAARTALAAGEAINTEYRVRDAAGEWRWMHNRGDISARDQDGRPLQAAGVLADITGRKALEMRLADSERHLSDAISAARIGVWRYDINNQHSTARGLLAELIGASPGMDEGEIVRRWDAAVHPEDFEAVKAQMAEMRAGKREAFDAFYRMRTADGGWLWVRSTGQVIERDANGNARTMTGVLVDVNDQRLLEEALREEKDRFATIYRATPAMMHTIGPDGRIIQVSDYWLSVMGYAREEVIGKPSVEFLDPESRERAETEVLPGLFETGFCRDVPYRFVRKDGSAIDVILNSFLERDAGGAPKASFAVLADVTAIRQAQTQLEKSNRELDRFATVASHDLQEPLRKISAFASLVRRRYESVLDDEGVRCLNFLVDAAQRMQALIDDLLEYSRASNRPIQPEKTDLAELVDVALDRLETAIRAGNAKVCIGELPVVTGDRMLLTQMIQNLLSNAVKYRGEAPPRIDISARREANGWTLTVRDNGIGLDPRFAEKIFAPFQRLHSREDYAGTGIGLALVQQAAERHGGRVRVESALGQGAAFHVFLPDRAPAIEAA